MFSIYLIIRHFVKVHSIDTAWNWIQSGLVKSLRADRWYNNEPPVGQRGFIRDRVSRIMGYANVRQVRVKPGMEKHN